VRTIPLQIFTVYDQKVFAYAKHRIMCDFYFDSPGLQVRLFN